RINFLFGWFKQRPDIVLLPDENQLPRCGVILVLEEIMHPKAEIFETEFPKVLARNGERIKIVLVQIPPKLSTSLFVFSPNETRSQEKRGRDDRSDHVNPNLALQGANHKFPAALERVIFSTATSDGRERE